MLSKGVTLKNENLDTILDISDDFDDDLVVTSKENSQVDKENQRQVADSNNSKSVYLNTIDSTESVIKKRRYDQE